MTKLWISAGLSSSHGDVYSGYATALVHQQQQVGGPASGAAPSHHSAALHLHAEGVTESQPGQWWGRGERSAAQGGSGSNSPLWGALSNFWHTQGRLSAGYLKQRKHKWPVLLFPLSLTDQQESLGQTLQGWKTSVEWLYLPDKDRVERGLQGYQREGVKTLLWGPSFNLLWAYNITQKLVV